MLTRPQKFFLSLFLLLLPSQLSFHFWPAFSFIRGARVDYLSPAIYLTDILLIVLVAIARPNIRFNQRRIYLLIPLVFLNIIFSLQPLFSLYLFTKIILLIIFVASYSVVPDFTSFTLKVLPSSLFWVSLLAVAQFVLKHSVGGLLYFVGERPLLLSSINVAKIPLGALGVFLRPYAVFPHPNALAGFFLVCYFIYLKYKPQQKLLMSVISFIIFLTFSRMAIFVYILLNIIYFLKRKSIYIFPLLVFPFFLPGNPQSFSERLLLILPALNIIFHHPLFGVGFGNYLISSPNFLLQPVHNLYLLLTAELGLPFIVYIFYLFGKYFSFPTAAILITGLADHYWITSHQNIFLIFIVLALVYNQAHVSSR